jgi:hypothetical protein
VKVNPLTLEEVISFTTKPFIIGCKLVITCNSSGFCVQPQLNFKWFKVTFATMVWLVPSSFKMDEFYILICANMLLYIVSSFLYKYVTKELELQNSNWFDLPESNNDPFHFKKTYLIHFKTNLNNFCDFGCVRCKIRISFWIISKTYL